MNVLATRIYQEGHEYKERANLSMCPTCPTLSNLKSEVGHRKARLGVNLSDLSYFLYFLSEYKNIVTVISKSYLEQLYMFLCRLAQKGRPDRTGRTSPHWACVSAHPIHASHWTLFILNHQVTMSLGD